MTVEMKTLRAVAALAAAVTLAPLPARAQAPPAPARYAPLIHGWESHFTVTTPEVFERRGRPWLAGHVTNQHGFTAMRVRLLVDALDDSGRVLAQRVSWLGSPVPPGARVYFEIPAPEAAARYRVAVFAFDWLQTASIEAP